MTQKILVTGGAGYIGSHMVKLLLDAHYNVVTQDNLSTYFRDAVSGGDFVQVSLLNVIHAVELVSGKTEQKQFAERCAGDPAQLVADSSLIRQTLGWAPKYEALDTIIAHAWDWEVKQKRYATN